ncbi:protein DGCR14-like isoform X2 [Sinocyclocheilus rhinocerous]|uniref:Protein DGCR14-like n=1 Tax=Sinocyclocheilus rhinocerous TaxID=307959 RepID=A0A673LXV1_9TELE|nr:PREDICTED: protein DGCR14-like isoform X1 [Sinocyclocheilus rhinocerous]XP_016431938.1 PREDICTED: protein DGCR14-like isoform X2 [Sinocyclocheilus rhinocerous]
MTESKEKALSVKSDVTTVAVRNDVVETKKPTRKILDEDEYIEGLEKIIQRDFFPDVSKLQAQNDYLEAEENGDMERMREIAIKYGSLMAKYTPRTYVPYTTPSTFETPDGRSASPSCSQSKHRAAKEDGKDAEKTEEKDLPSLDRFLAKNTSEDNASFEQIMELAEDKDKLRHAWLYEAENEFKERHEQNLALPSTEKQALECTKAGVETWQYKAKNALMYYPEGEKDDTLFKKPREVLYKNTRFDVDPFCKALNKSQIQQAAALHAQFKQGKVGPDGKELLPHESPKVNGYGFEGEASPAPGVAESPLMTWGEIESTPFRLDGSDSPLVERSHGPSFKIPEPGRRERLGLKMANEAAAKNRAKKQEALRKVTENLASLTPKGLSPAALSPALQRLVNRSSSKYTDKALRASYTPSPAHRGMGSKTPLGGPATSSITPTPGKTRTPATQDPASITDNLLQLPKRRKAADYFGI